MSQKELDAKVGEEPIEPSELLDALATLVNHLVNIHHDYFRKHPETHAAIDLLDMYYEEARE